MFATRNPLPRPSLPLFLDDEREMLSGSPETLGPIAPQTALSRIALPKPPPDYGREVFPGPRQLGDALSFMTPARKPRLFGSSLPVQASAAPLPGEVKPATSGQLPALPAQGEEQPQRLPVLGGSMREPFDYDALQRQILPEVKEPGTLKKIAMILGPMLMAMGGNQAGANAFIQQFAQQRRDREQQRLEGLRLIGRMKHDDWARQNAADLRAANPFTIGRDRLQYDPATGEVATLYDGAEEFEEYAEAMGLEPGSEEYFQAVEDYVLRSSGPSAHARDVELDDHRTANDRSLEGYRQQHRVGLEDLRQRNRSGLEATRQGNRLDLRGTPSYRDLNPRSRASSGRPARPTATGPNGAKVEWNGKAWVPVR
jgi:hypothetical protein